MMGFAALYPSYALSFCRSQVSRTVDGDHDELSFTPRSKLPSTF